MSFRDRMKNKGFETKDFRTFVHDNRFTFPELIDETTSTGRTYITPDGNRYPSITTVLSIDSKDSIAKWRARVGEVEANRISTKASERGTRIHAMCEDYINNEYANGYKAIPDIANDRDNFLKIKQHLDKNVGKVYALEVPLYSDQLQMAGRTDLIGDWADLGPAVIDFKTATKPKEEKWIQSYFKQGAGYCAMFRERTGKSIQNIVIIIAVDNNPAQVFIKKRSDYLPELLETRERYRQHYGR
jgi:hypothetical protein